MSDEVSQFLEQVERLRGKQIEDDAARAREREEFLAAKRERQARREERARSISPQKSSPLNTPSPRSNRQSVQLSDAVRFSSPDRTCQNPESSETPSLGPRDPILSRGPPAAENDASSVEAETTQAESSISTPLTRTSTLSWQRRPTSRGAVRPLSMVAAQNATQRSLVDMQHPASATDEVFPKNQVAKNPESKDPSWVRQTADREDGPSAHSRIQVEDDNLSDVSSARAQLPAMSAAEVIPKSDSGGPKPDLEEPHHSALASPVTFKPALVDGASDDIRRSHEFSTTSGRTSPTRSPSPTKGLGGFVQSAMLKRSDSVKRWSVASPPRLTRADSVTASRGAYDRSSLQIGPRQDNATREGSMTPTSSRPASRHENKTPELEFSRKGSVGDASHENQPEDEVVSPPTSPFKTTEFRRWSPAKSSWLESALNRPDSPKLATSPTQPTWREKAAMESSRPTSTSHKHQVSIGGLLRQSALGSVAKSNPTGLGGIYSPPPNANRPAYGHGSRPSISQKQPDPEALQNTEPETPTEKVQNTTEKSAVSETIKQTPTMSPPPVKPEPLTPTTKDFRSNLRQRAAEREPPKSNEPEFKNVFGNLRRTKTQKFVAQDELKDNILRGKAGLNHTDGPKKSEKKDDFRDAILKKKADFKTAQMEGRGVSRTSSNASENPIPEGLARRANLGSKSAATAAKKNSLSETPTAAPFQKTDSPKQPSPGPKNAPTGSTSSPRSANTATPPPPSAKNTSTEKTRRVSTGPQEAKAKAGETPTTPGLLKESSAPPRLSTQGRPGVGSGKLADRFNPALAGLLAKGPPSMSANGGRGAGASGESVSLEAGTSAEPPVPAPQLTHMTKNRARGPKRKAPTSSKAEASSGRPDQLASPSSASVATSEKVPLTTGSEHDVPAGRPHSEKIDVAAVSPSDEKPADIPVRDEVALEASPPRNPSPTSRPKPAALTWSSQREQPQAVGSSESTPTSPTKTGRQPESNDLLLPSPKKLDVKRMSRFFDGTSFNNIEQESSREPVRLAHQQTGSRSPIKVAEPPSPTKSDRDFLPSVRDASPRFGGRWSPVAKPSSDEPTTSDGLETRSRPSSCFAGEDLKLRSAMTSPIGSPTKQANEVSALLSNFFGSSQTRQAMKFDPAQILMDGSETGSKVTSLGFQMFRILGDGKKVPVPAQHERVLFDQEMYVCAHNFLDRSKKKALEVYFWVGDEVSQSLAEDAQRFVQRETRSLGGKLVRLGQGKETAEFVQALGGVMTVRKGSSNKYDSLAPNMLCGRGYLGQIAFDEVDFSPSNLCSGFTYLLSRGGNCYLWKGKGSDVTEISCARLVGMEMTLTGELIECEDGSEPASFWELFDDKSSRPHSADHWRLKPSCDKYRSRLFCSDADSRQQILEISPFNQGDLSPTSIYILDAFFEIYIIVGARANSQYSSFCNALDFAQEYGILASGMEDRPFVPITTVVLEGIPRDLKRVFRKWDDSKSPTVTHPAGSGTGLRRGRSLRVVTLTQALQALNEL